LLKSVAAKWLPPETSRTPLGTLDELGWQPFGRDFVTSDERKRLMEQVYTQYCFGTRDFHIGTGPRRALCDLLELCWKDGIQALLVLMPEGEDFRGWYSPGMKSELPRFLAELQERYLVNVIDA